MSRMFSKFSLLDGATLTVLGALLLPLAGCGTPDYCEDQGPNGFDTFRNQEWVPYCQQFETKLSDPLSYELTDLTDTFSEFPEKSAEMKKQLATWEKPEACFESKMEQLELRRLESCLEYDAETDSKIQRAWEIRAKPWVEDYEKQVKKLQRQLGDLKIDATRIDEKITQKFDLSAPMDDKMVVEFGTSISDVEPQISSIDKAKLDYERFVSSSMANPSLNTFIEENYGEVIQQILKDHEDNRFAIAKLRGQERYFTYAANTVGKKCIEGPSARKEDKILRKVLGEKMTQAKAGKTINVSQKITKSTDEKTSDEVETIKGFFCGLRAQENQFDGKPSMCSQHHFEVKRIRPAGERRWKDWELVEVKEGDIPEGVDCAKLDRGK
ncbi:MAG: hypothetical protein VX475_11735 [Myxococcota bacterium]|nr:hypothetical protein [Myxococcota bacterium]